MWSMSLLALGETWSYPASKEYNLLSANLTLLSFLC